MLEPAVKAQTIIAILDTVIGFYNYYLLHNGFENNLSKKLVKFVKAANNIRDYLLLYLVFETGMRIGEALSLWLEGIEISDCTISILDRGELENLAEIKTVSSPRKLDFKNVSD